MTWINSDTAPHTVTSNSVPSSAKAFDSGNMNAGDKFSYTFTVAGTYTYYCKGHQSWIEGTVNVAAP